MGPVKDAVFLFSRTLLVAQAITLYLTHNISKFPLFLKQSGSSPIITAPSPVVFDEDECYLAFSTHFLVLFKFTLNILAHF